MPKTEHMRPGTTRHIIVFEEAIAAALHDFEDNCPRVCIGVKIHRQEGKRFQVEAVTMSEEAFRKARK